MNHGDQADKMPWSNAFSCNCACGQEAGGGGFSSTQRSAPWFAYFRKGLDYCSFNNIMGHIYPLKRDNHTFLSSFYRLYFFIMNHCFNF